MGAAGPGTILFKTMLLEKDFAETQLSKPTSGSHRFLFLHLEPAKLEPECQGPGSRK